MGSAQSVHCGCFEPDVMVADGTTVRWAECMCVGCLVVVCCTDDFVRWALVAAEAALAAGPLAAEVSGDEYWAVAERVAELHMALVVAERLHSQLACWTLRCSPFFAAFPVDTRIRKSSVVNNVRHIA